MGGWEHYNKKERRRILWRDMVLEDTPGLMWGPQGTLHVRSSSFEGTRDDTWRKLLHAPKNTQAYFGLLKACLGGMCPFRVSCVSWGLVMGFDFSISYFKSEEDARERTLSLHTLHAGNEKSLKPWQERRRRIMLCLGWVLLCFVAGERTAGFDPSGRGFCFAY